MTAKHRPSKRELQLEARIRELEMQLEKSQQDNCGLRAFNGAHNEGIKIVLPFLKDAQKEIFELVIKEELGDVEEFKKAVMSIYRNTVTAMLRNQALLRYFGSDRCSEKFNQRKDAVQGKELTDELQKTIIEATKNTNQAQRLLAGAVNAANRSINALKKVTEENPSLAEAYRTIKDTERIPHLGFDVKTAEFVDEISKPDGHKYYGRQLSKHTLEAKTTPSNTASMICPRCNKPMTLISDCLPIERLKTLNGDFSAALAELVEVQMKLWYCRACKKAVLDIPPEAIVPILPTNQEVAQDVIINANYFFHHGVPLNRFEEVFLKPMALGNDTLLRLRQQFSNLYEKPLWQAINQNVATQVLLVDETVYPCLETQGRGCKVEDSEVGKGSAQKNYVLVYSNSSREARQIRGFRYIGGRNTEAIIQGLQGMKPEVLVTDAYGAYGRVLKEHFPGTKHQCCLVHFRRTILEALNFEALKKETRRLSDEELEQRFTQLIDKSPTQINLLVMLDAITKIFSCERNLSEVRLDDESNEQYLARVKQMRQEYSRPLVQSIDRIMQEVIADSKTYPRSPYEKVVTYYVNQREALWYFLEDPRVMCHTNAVEQSVRTLVIARQAAKFAQTQDGVNALCLSTSIFETAYANGIENPVEWLCAYGRAYYKHCYEKRWEQELANEKMSTKNPEKRFQQWDFMELGKDFDFEPWMPWNWKTSQGE